SAFLTGTTGMVQVNANPQVFTGTSDTGTATVTTAFGTLPIQVTLTIGNVSTTGLAVSPNPLNLTAVFGQGLASQNVNVTNNGSPVAIQSVSPTTGAQTWLLTSQSGVTGQLAVSINGANLTQGSYSSVITINTASGSANLTVNLTIGGGSTSGLAATPSPVFL